MTSLHILDATKFAGHKINSTESEQWGKSSIDCASRCGGNKICKGFSVNTGCEHYKEEFPDSSGVLEADNIWVRGQWILCIILKCIVSVRSDYPQQVMGHILQALFDLVILKVC